MKIDLTYTALDTSTPTRPLVKTWGGFIIEASPEALKKMYIEVLSVKSEIEKLQKPREKASL